MQLPCMFKETCMSQYCEYSVVCMLHATCIENIQNPCMLCACYMHTTCKHAWQTSQIPACYMLHCKNMPVTCRDLGRISTRAVSTIPGRLARFCVEQVVFFVTYRGILRSIFLHHLSPFCYMGQVQYYINP